MSLPKKLSFILSSVLMGSLLFASVAQAIVIKAQDEIFLNEYLTEDVYLAGGNITIQQDVEGDLIIAGGNVTVNGIVSGDLDIAGGNVIVNGEVLDDLRMLGGSLSLNADVTGDMIVIGGAADINKDVMVGGDLVSLAGATNVYGTINRSIIGIMGRLTLGGEVNGDIDVRVTEKLVLLNTAHVYGNVKYFSPERIEDHGGLIDGEIAFNEILSSGEKVKEGVQKYLNRGVFMGKLWSFLSLMLVGLFIIWLFPNMLHRTSEHIKKKGLKSFGMGFLVFVVGGMVSLISVFTVIGVQLAFIVVSLLFVLGELGRITSAYWLGTLIIRHDNPKKMKSKRKRFGLHIGVLALGLFIMKLIGIIPVLGWFAGFFFLMMGAGALFMISRSNYRQLIKEKLV
jgi:uncharacterized membrane protein